MIKKLFFVWSLFFALGTLTSCREEDPEIPEIIDDGSGNTSDIAVTSLVEECGITYATISGYVNLNLLASGVETLVIGIEMGLVKTTDEGESIQGCSSETTEELVGRKFVIDFTGLYGNSKYQYRTFVKSGGMTYYGEYRTFTTKDFTNLTSTGDAADITFTSVNITSGINKKSVNEKENLGIGIAYSRKKSKLRPDSIFSIKSFPINELKDETYTICLNKLLTGETYYYASFTKAGGTYKLGAVKNFTTKSLQGQLVTGDATDITLSSAIIRNTSSIASLYPQGTNIIYGIRYATSEDNLDVAEIPEGFILYEQYSEYDRYYNPQTGEIIKVFKNYKTTTATITDESANNITVQLNRLAENQTYYYCVYAKVDGAILTGEVKNFTTKSLDEYLTIDNATDITFTSATLRGITSLSTLYENNSASILYYFKYSTYNNDLDDSGYHDDYETATPTLNGDSLTATLYNLSEGITYYYCLCANIDGVIVQSKVKEFTTNSLAKYIQTGGATEITVTTANIAGTTTLSSLFPNDTQIDYYIYYATSEADLSSSNKRKKTIASRDHENIQATLLDLASETLYYYQVVAKIDYNKFVYSDIRSFTTKSGTDFLFTGESSNITMTSAHIMGETLLSEIYPRQYSIQYKVFYGTDTEHLSNSTNMSLSEKELSATLLNLTVSTTYHYCIAAVVGNVTVFGDIKTFTTNHLQTSGSIDLGLSCKWAACNIGALSPEFFGDFFAWGDIETKPYFYSSNYNNYNKNLGRDISGTDYDAAREILGKSWRMPTRDDFKELYNKCVWKEIVYNNTKGYLIIGPNTNAIFLPKAGYKHDETNTNDFYYWTSNDYQYPTVAGYLHYYAYVWYGKGDKYIERYYGCPIRPVQD